MSRHRTPEQSNVALLILAVVLAGVFLLTVVAAVGVIRAAPVTVSVAQGDLPAITAVPAQAVSAPAQIHAAPVSHPTVAQVPASHPARHVASQRHSVRHHVVKHHHRAHHRHDRHRRCP